MWDGARGKPWAGRGAEEEEAEARGEAPGPERLFSAVFLGLLKAPGPRLHVFLLWQRLILAAVRV